MKYLGLFIKSSINHRTSLGTISSGLSKNQRLLDANRLGASENTGQGGKKVRTGRINIFVDENMNIRNRKSWTYLLGERSF